MDNYFGNRYPYTDFHELNLDWIIRRMRELEIDMDEFKVVNNITFSGQWDITKQYPAWTIVSDNNIGYVSLKPVPVGVPLTNGSYWVEVIDYTAQIAGLETRVINIENDIRDNIKPDIQANANDIADIKNELNSKFNRKLLCISDSYGMRHATNWTSLMNARFNSRSASYSGRGFLPSGNTFLMTLQDFNSQITDQDEITDIIIGGGWNDAREIENGATPTDLQNAIITCYTYIRNNFPNAVMHLAFMAGQTSYNVQPEVTAGTIERVRYVYNNTFKDQIHHIMTAQYPMQNTWNMDNSYFHPNDGEGAIDLYECIAAEITGHYEYERIYDVTQSDLDTSYVSSFHCYLSVKNGTQIVKTNNFSINATSNLICVFNKDKCPIFPLSIQTSMVGWFNGTVNGSAYEGLAYFIFNGSTRELKVRLNGYWTNITSLSGYASFELTTSVALQSKTL